MTIGTDLTSTCWHLHKPIFSQGQIIVLSWVYSLSSRSIDVRQIRLLILPEVKHMNNKLKALTFYYELLWPLSIAYLMLSFMNIEESTKSELDLFVFTTYTKKKICVKEAFLLWRRLYSMMWLLLHPWARSRPEQRSLPVINVLRHRLTYIPFCPWCPASWNRLLPCPGQIW